MHSFPRTRPGLSRTLTGLSPGAGWGFQPEQPPHTASWVPAARTHRVAAALGTGQCGYNCEKEETVNGGGGGKEVGRARVKWEAAASSGERFLLHKFVSMTPAPRTAGVPAPRSRSRPHPGLTHCTQVPEPGQISPRRSAASRGGLWGAVPAVARAPGQTQGWKKRKHRAGEKAAGAPPPSAPANQRRGSAGCSAGEPLPSTVQPGRRSAFLPRSPRPVWERGANRRPEVLLTSLENSEREARPRRPGVSQPHR